MAADHFGLDPARDRHQRVTNLVRSPTFVAYLQAGVFDDPVVEKLRFIHDLVNAGRAENENDDQEFKRQESTLHTLPGTPKPIVDVRTTRIPAERHCLSASSITVAKL